MRFLHGALVTVLATLLLGFVNGFLLFVSWKGAVALDAAVLVAAAFLWVKANRSSAKRLVATGAGLATVVVAGVAWPFWFDHARHDARLAGMVDDLCAVDVPHGTSVEGCTGSITNTGNGDSCRYLATATVETDDPVELESMLADEGFLATDVDAWGDPIADGRSYRRVGERYELALQASRQPEGNDLRCT